MRSKIDGLLITLNQEMNNKNFDLSDLYKQLNSQKLEEYDIYRIAIIFKRNKKWYWFWSLIGLVILSYIVLSALLSIIFTTVLVMLSMIMPIAFSTGITLFFLLVTMSYLQRDRL